MNRWAKAGIAFALAFAAAGVVWQNGRREGIHEGMKETTQATASPTPAGKMVPLSGRTEADDVQRFAELRAQSQKAQTAEQKRVTGNALYELAHSAHNENRGGGILSRDAYLLAQRVYHEAGDGEGEVHVLTDFSDTQMLLGQPAAAEKSLRTALALHRAHKGQPLKEADILYRLGDFLRIQGRYKEAKSCLNDSLALRQKANDEPGIADCLKASGQVAFEEGSPALAQQLFREAVQLFAQNGKIESRAAVLGQLGDVALAQNDPATAERLFHEGLAVWREKKQDFWIGRFLSRLAEVSLRRNNLPEAKRLAEESVRLLASSNGPVAQAHPLLVLGQIAARENRPAAAQRHFAAARALYERIGYAYGMKKIGIRD